MSITEVISPDYIQVMTGVALGVAATLAVTWVRQVDIAWAQQRLNASIREDAAADAQMLAEHRKRFAEPAAVEARPVDATVLAVAYPTQEMRLVDGLDRLRDEVGLVQAVGCCTAHGDELEPCAQDSGLVPPYCCDDCPDRTPALSDRPTADEDEVGDEQPGEAWFDRVKDAFDDMARGAADAVNWPIRLVQRVAAAWRRRRDERHLIGSGEQAVDPSKPLAEVLAASGYELDIADEQELDAQRAEWVEVNAQPYIGRHWITGTEHTGIFPQINVPAQRTGDEA